MTRTKRHLVVDQTGLPLATRPTSANRHDSMVFDRRLDAILAIKTSTDRRRKRSAKPHADKAYDYPRCRRALTQRHTRVRIAQKSVDSSTHPGRHRWVVEHTLTWLHHARRLRVRDEQRADIHQVFLTLGCVPTCFKALP